MTELEVFSFANKKCLWFTKCIFNKRRNTENKFIFHLFPVNTPSKSSYVIKKKVVLPQSFSNSSLNALKYLELLVRLLQGFYFLRMLSFQRFHVLLSSLCVPLQFDLKLRLLTFKLLFDLLQLFDLFLHFPSPDLRLQSFPHTEGQTALV